MHFFAAGAQAEKKKKRKKREGGSGSGLGANPAYLLIHNPQPTTQPLKTKD
jgi:hypothetical protein